LSRGKSRERNSAPLILSLTSHILVLSRILMEASVNQQDKKWVITPELEAEFQEAVRQAMSAKRDPEAMRRAAERMDRMREETYRRHGLLDIGVPAIRALRGELPE
jgi:hypothetical protein